MLSEKTEIQARILAKLIRELRRAEAFETLADLTDALKYRCARLRIRWTPDDISDAFRLIETNTPLVPTRLVRRLEERSPEPEIIEQPFAAAFVAELGNPIRTLASAPWTDPEHAHEAEQAARERAWEMGIEL